MNSNNEKWLLLNLPSKCLAYENIDKSKLMIRPLKGKDEKLIAEISGDNFEKKFLAVLRQIVQGIDVEKLTLGDRLYIAIWEAMNSYSEKFFLKHECEHCWQSSEYAIDLSKLDIIELPDNYHQPYEIKLSESGDVVKVRLLTISDSIKIDEMDKSGQNVWLYRYALGLEFPEGNVFQKMEYLENLPVKDLAIIRAFHDKFYHGPKMEQKYECSKCGGTGIMPVPFQIKFLFPYGIELVRHFGSTI
jgi:hypothetical protein